jgi:hypothetical protein
MQPGLPPRALTPPFSGALPVDIAISPAGDTFAIAVAGNHNVHQIRSTAFGEDKNDDDDCPTGGHEDVVSVVNDRLGAPTSVAYTSAICA